MIKVEFAPQSEHKQSCNINLSNSAIAKLQKTLSTRENSFLRIKIDNGGCNGLKYAFAIDNEKQNGDISQEVNNIKIVVNENVCDLVNGAELDYIEDLQASRFTLTNKNAENSCSCGNSFSI